MTPRSFVALGLCGTLLAPAARAAEPSPAAAPPAPAPTAPAAPAAEAAAPAAPAAPAAEAAPAPVQPKNRSLAYARELLAKGRNEDALKELDTATQLPGNTLQVTAEISAARAQALLLGKKSDPKRARELVVEVLHVDPEAKLFEGAPERLAQLVREVRAEQVLVLHDRVQVAKPGRPLKLRARLIDPQSRVDRVELHYKPHNVPTYSSEPMKLDRAGNYNAILRDPLALAPMGIDDGFFVDYFLAAADQKGLVLDTLGSERKPIVIEFSTTKMEETVGALGGQQEEPPALAELREGPPPAPAPVVAPEKPWYTRWYTLTGAGVVVAAIAGGTIYALSQDPELKPHIGTISLPVKP